MTGLEVKKIQKLLSDSDNLFSAEIPFPVDSGYVLRRNVTALNQDKEIQQSFIEWFDSNIVSAVLQQESVSVDQRVFLLSGRAGQGKSTLLRHMFVQLRQSQIEKDEQILPNFNDRVVDFFHRYHDKVIYYQARKLPKRVDKIPKDRRLIFIDGLDEMDEDRVEVLADAICNYPKSVFLISSRSRYSSREPMNEHVIRRREFQDLLVQHSLEIPLEQNTAYLKSMINEEKVTLLGLMKRFDKERDYSQLTTLVENNSPNLSRPADFLLYRAQKPRTNSEYYVRHLAWLFDREFGKELQERKLELDNIIFDDLFESSKVRIDEDRIVIDIKDKKTANALRILNLLDVEGSGRTEKYFLDLSTPSTKGLFLVNAGGHKHAREITLEEMGQQKRIDVASCVEGVFKDPYKRILSKCIDGIERRSNEENESQEKRNIAADFVSSIFSGYTNESSSALEELLEEHSNEIEKPIAKLHFLVWLVDIFHPIAELRDGYSQEPLHPILESILKSFFEDKPREISEGSDILHRLFLRLSQVSPTQLDLFKWFEALTVSDDQKTDINTYKQNTRSKQRIFHTMEHLLKKAEPKLNQSDDLELWSDLAMLLIDKAEFQNKPQDIFLNCKDRSFAFKYWEMLGAGSKFSGQIFEYFVNLSLNPRLKYLNFINDVNTPELLETDDNSGNWIGKMADYSQDLFAKSVANGLELIDMIPHLAPSNLGTMTIKLPNSILYDAPSYAKLLVESGYPHNNRKLKKLKNNLFEQLNSESKDKIYPYALYGGLLSWWQLGKITKSNSENFHQSLCDLCEKGDFFSALLLGLRSSELDATSILLECELTNDGFSKTKSRIVGNYLHRRVLSDKFTLQNPNDSRYIVQLADTILPTLKKELQNIYGEIIERWNFEKEGTQILGIYADTAQNMKSIIESSIDVTSSEPIFSINILTKELIYHTDTGDEFEASGESWGHVGWKWFEKNFEGKVDLIPFKWVSYMKPQNYKSIDPETITFSDEPFPQLPLDSRFRQFSVHLKTKSLYLITEDERRKQISYVPWKWLEENFSEQIETEDEVSNQEIYFYAHTMVAMSPDPDNIDTDEIVIGHEDSNFAINPVTRSIFSRTKSGDTERFEHEDLDIEIEDYPFNICFSSIPTQTITFHAELNPDIEISSIDFSSDEANFTLDLQNYSLKGDGGFSYSIESTDDLASYLEWFSEIKLSADDFLLTSVIEKYIHEMNGDSISQFKRSICEELLNYQKEEWMIESSVDGGEIIVKEKTRWPPRDIAFNVLNRYESAIHTMTSIFEPLQLVPLPGHPITGFSSSMDPRNTVPNSKDLTNSIGFEDEFNEEIEQSFPLKFELVDLVHNNPIETSTKNKLRYCISAQVDDEWILYEGLNYKGEPYYVDIEHYYFLEHVAKKKLMKELKEQSHRFDGDELSFLLSWLKDVEMFHNPMVVGDLLKHGSDVALRGWHSIPYIQGHASRGLEELDDLSHLSEMEIDSYMEHFLNDESLLAGTNIKILQGRNNSASTKVRVNQDIYSVLEDNDSDFERQSPNVGETDRFYSIFNEKIASWTHHTKSQHHSTTQGMFALIDDSSAFLSHCYNRKLIERDDESLTLSSEILHSQDLRSWPVGLRSIISRFPQITDYKELTKGRLSFASTLLSALKHAHIRSSVQDSSSVYDKFSEEKTELASGFWSIDTKQDNPIYGRKFGLYLREEFDPHDEDITIGFAEIEQLSYSKNEFRDVCTTFVEFDDSKFAKNNRIVGHTSWLNTVEDCNTIQQRLEESKEHDEIGRRVCRTFGIVVDSGGFDQDIRSYLDNCLVNLEDNFHQLQSEKPVFKGRGNLINLIREISRFFSYSEWTEEHEYEFNRVREKFENILKMIESEEYEQMGHNLPGTKRDFRLIRSILKGIYLKQNEQKEAIKERKQSIIKSMNSTKTTVDEIKHKLDPILHRFDQEDFEEFAQAAEESSFTKQDKQILRRFFTPYKRLKVRILGLSQSMFPYALDARWQETVGSLNQDQHDCRIGSLVRFDLKAMHHTGSIKPIISNIAYASDEWDEEGELAEKFNLDGEEIIWPEPLPRSTWLGLETKAELILGRDDLPLKNIPLFIKAGRKYATHPDVEVEIPIFGHKDFPSDICSTKLRLCTIDIRRDRRKGLFRYHVTKVGEIVE